MTVFLFYFFSVIAILSALSVIFQPKPTRALFSLIVTMFALSGLYILLGAPFVAMVHLIVYAGAILVLFLFVIMLQGIGAQDIPLKQRFTQSYLIPAALTVLGLAVALMAIFLGPLKGLRTLPHGIYGSVEQIGKVLFFDNLLPFELTSILILIGVFAAIVLAKKEDV